MRRAFALPGARSKPRKRRERPLSEKKLLQAGRAHFSKDFPNPGRIGCPPAEKLKQLAEHPGHADESVLSHISFCSPCYRAYGRFLQARKKQIRAKTHPRA
jgi:hypothetical protein